ncbi:MAG: polyprenyl synthetase family protein [Planctomycetota bacterium]|jgi:geranylgeranyl pyrophosphate synthase
MRKDTIATTRAVRPPQDNIPKTKQQRDRLLRIVTEYVERERIVSPLSLDELRKHSEAIVNTSKEDSKYRDFLAVLISNRAWRKTIAGIGYNRRLLLLPKCLTNRDNCRGRLDEFGLVCEHCGRCVIDELKGEAEQLGYAVLIAEGSPVVMSLIEKGKIEGIIGVSCLCVLEKTFPYMEAGAVPGIAIPLLQDGCANTSVDIDWVWDAIYENSVEQVTRLDLDGLRREVDSWFTLESLEGLLSRQKSETEKLAIRWLGKEGKRWRPFLAVCTFKALTEKSRKGLPDELRGVAVAVECFHKASLIHDDIEDGDTARYGEKTLHAEFGVLIGEGYRLLAELKSVDGQKAQMLQAATEGHRYLCLGQGDELLWMRKPKPLSAREVTGIFEKKTSPAFGVALKLGAILAGTDNQLHKVLEQYSRSLGIAYQIKDDISDFTKPGQSGFGEVRLSLLPALAYELSEGEDKELLESMWISPGKSEEAYEKLQNIFSKLKVEEAALNLMQFHKSEAIRALGMLDNTALKQLLRRIISKIFNDIEVMGCCNEYKAGHAGGGEQG